jgi:lipid A 4'-phosphatase
MTVAARDGGPDHALAWRLCLAACLVAGAGFLLFPGIDLWLTRAVYSGSGRFVGGEHAWVKVLRNAFVVFYFACLGISLAGWIAPLRLKKPWLGTSPQQWLFLVLCLSIGPGLVANLIFKDQWGRARPKQVIEFGGTKQFTAAPLPARQCKRGCSFVSGEASTTFVPFYAAAVIVPQWAAALVVTGTISGLVAGFVRISQGGHFLSDVVFAGLFMAIVVLALSRLMRPNART